MSPSWKPESYTSLSPYLITKDAQAVIDFLVAALDAELLRRFDDDDGALVHAEVRVDDTVVMMGEAGEAWPAAPSHLHLYVRDVDASYRKALDAGGDVVQAPARREGDLDRRGGVRDPGGNTWWLATRETEGQ